MTRSEAMSLVLSFALRGAQDHPFRTEALETVRKLVEGMRAVESTDWPAIHAKRRSALKPTLEQYLNICASNEILQDVKWELMKDVEKLTTKLADIESHQEETIYQNGELISGLQSRVVMLEQQVSQLEADKAALQIVSQGGGTW